MATRYLPLERHLQNLAEQGELQIELTFGAVDRLVGGLPESARRLRTWWANNSQGHALAWGRAGWHVDRVDLPGQRVTFVVGQVGGTYAARKAGRPSRTDVAATSSTPVSIHDLPRLENAELSLRFAWRPAGDLGLDATGRPVFPRLPAQPGLYRMTLMGGRQQPRGRVYIGETDNLKRRLSGNYRNPGPRQQTSLRVNSLLREHLSGGGAVQLDVVEDASVGIGSGGVLRSIDLTRKAPRLLVESAALVMAQIADTMDIENLG